MFKIEEFAQLLEKEQLERIIGSNLDCEANRRDCLVKIIPGRKYTKVNVGRSGKYMVDKEGNIWGIKGYGQVHKGHHYGTLDTIYDWNWGRYVAIKKYEHIIKDEIIYK